MRILWLLPGLWFAACSALPPAGPVARAAPLSAAQPAPPTQGQLGAPHDDCRIGTPASGCTVRVFAEMLATPITDASGLSYPCRVTYVEPHTMQVRGSPTLHWLIDQPAGPPLFQFHDPAAPYPQGGIEIVGNRPDDFGPPQLQPDKARLSRHAVNQQHPLLFHYNVIVTHRDSPTAPTQLCLPLDPIIINVE